MIIILILDRSLTLLRSAALALLVAQAKAHTREVSRAYQCSGLVIRVLLIAIRLFRIFIHTSLE
jgi:hypothetical protein